MSAELSRLMRTIAHRVGCFLERQGLLQRDAENIYVSAELYDAESLNELFGHSIVCRVAVLSLTMLGSEQTLVIVRLVSGAVLRKNQ